ncbi:MAG: NAD(P)-dependent oxidoreductase [Chloroflexi bacterium]|nr:NAD(P)-dependent oxidoreductase [Chloroflexota bacterium]
METPHRPRILITGGCGRIGLLLARGLADRYDFTLLDRRPPPSDLSLPFVRADIAQLDTIRSHFQGHDSVVHLAADPRPHAPWDSLLANNIIGVRNVLEAACEAGCRRVILASSLHAVLGYAPRVVVRADMPPSPADLYGASKAWAETLGSYYAHQWGLSVLCVRIGWLKDLSSLAPGDPHLDRVITPRDLVHLLACCIEAPDDLRYGVFHGLSANRGRRFDITEAQDTLGYRPQDDAFALARRNYGALLRRSAGRAYRALVRMAIRARHFSEVPAKSRDSGGTSWTRIAP